MVGTEARVVLCCDRLRIRVTLRRLSRIVVSVSGRGSYAEDKAGEASTQQGANEEAADSLGEGPEFHDVLILLKRRMSWLSIKRLRRRSGSYSFAPLPSVRVMIWSGLMAVNFSTAPLGQ